MRDRLLLPMFVFLSLLSLGSFAQEGSAENFDPRDLSGVWYGSGGGGGDVSFGPDMPQLRAEGEAVYLTRIPTHSVDPRVPAVDNPALSNDPTFTCNPRGFPRVIFDTAPRTFEFVHIHNRLLQLHQRGRTLREFWLDGREVPSPRTWITSDRRGTDTRSPIGRTTHVFRLVWNVLRRYGSYVRAAECG